MVLAIDIGNSNIVVGCIKNDNIVHLSRMVTNPPRTEYEYAVNLKYLLEFNGVNTDEFDGAIISSVVPPLTSIFEAAVKRLTGKNPVIVGSGIKTGLKIMIDNPAQMGSDLVADAVAAINLYKPPVIVFDMGTATTMSVIGKEGEYLGGAIYPGVTLSLGALSQNTSQLPSISLEVPRTYIGKNTIDCMRSGIVYGTASVVDGMIDRFENELGEKATVVATGGHAKFIIPYCRHEIILNKELLMSGLNILYKKNCKRNIAEK